MLFSIIIPCYNSSFFIQRCVNSLRSQTCTDYEIIIVNDGSTDNSLVFLENEVLLHGNNTRVLNCEHRGPLISRIEGIKIAKGDYLVFVDSDDLLPPFSLNILKESIQKYRPDVVSFKNLHHPQKTYICDYKVEILKKNDIWRFGGFGLWNKVYKNSKYDLSYIIKNYSNLTVNEDFLLAFELMKNSTTIISLNIPLYINCIDNNNSITATHTHDLSRIMKMEAYYYILKNMSEYGYGEHGISIIRYESCEKFKDRLLTICATNVSLLQKYHCFKVGKKTLWYKEYNHYFFDRDIWKSKMMNKKQKAFIIGYKFHLYFLLLVFSKIYLAGGTHHT